MRIFSSELFTGVRSLDFPPLAHYVDQKFGILSIVGRGGVVVSLPLSLLEHNEGKLYASINNGQSIFRYGILLLGRTKREFSNWIGAI